MLRLDRPTLTRSLAVWYRKGSTTKGEGMFHVIGKITKRILSGEIDSSAVYPAKRGESPPSTKAIKSAKGQGMGKGATRRRSGPGAE